MHRETREGHMDRFRPAALKLLPVNPSLPSDPAGFSTNSGAVLGSRAAQSGAEPLPELSPKPSAS